MSKYIACKKDSDDTIHYFGLGETVQEALDDFDVYEGSDACDNYEDGDTYEIGVYEHLGRDQMDQEELEMAESEGWYFMLGKLVHECDVTIKLG